MSETDGLSSPTRAKREPYKSLDKAAIRHKNSTLCKTVADSKYSEFNPGWGSVISLACIDPEEALESARLLMEKGCGGRKVLVKRQKYCSTANRVLYMPGKI